MLKYKSELGLINIDYLEYLPNRLTPIYSKNYYKEENYLTVKTVCLNVTDLINWIVQVLREDLERLAINARDAGLMEPVKPWDEG